MSDGNEKLYDFVARSNAAGLLCEDPSKTVQSDMEDADINVIVSRYAVTGQLPQSDRVPQYADYEGVFDFRSAQEAILQAQRDFMSMPAKVRAEFDNNPQIFLEFASDPNNIDDMRRLGLAVPKEVVDTPPAGGDSASP